MRAAIALILPFVASTLAFTVSVPNGVDGWTTNGLQPLNWSFVETDRLNFTVVLTNQVDQGFERQVLAALVDRSTQFTLISPQNGGFPVGQGFRVNLVQDSQNLDTILAQSSQFNITDGTSTLTSTSPTPTATGSKTSVATSLSSDTTPSSASSEPNASIIPVNSSAASSSFPVQSGLLALFSLLGFALA